MFHTEIKLENVLIMESCDEGVTSTSEVMKIHHDAVTSSGVDPVEGREGIAEGSNFGGHYEDIGHCDSNCCSSLGSEVTASNRSTKTVHGDLLIDSCSFSDNNNGNIVLERCNDMKKSQRFGSYVLNDGAANQLSSPDVDRYPRAAYSAATEGNGGAFEAQRKPSGESTQAAPSAAAVVLVTELDTSNSSNDNSSDSSGDGSVLGETDSLTSLQMLCLRRAPTSYCYSTVQNKVCNPAYQKQIQYYGSHSCLQNQSQESLASVCVYCSLTI